MVLNARRTKNAKSQIQICNEVAYLGIRDAEWREVAVGGRGEKYTAHGRTSIVVVRLKDVSNGRTLKFQLRR